MVWYLAFAIQPNKSIFWQLERSSIPSTPGITRYTAMTWNMSLRKKTSVSLLKWTSYFEDHNACKVNIANAVMELIRKSISYYSCYLFRKFYLAFVGPHQEFAHAILGSTQQETDQHDREPPNTCSQASWWPLLSWLSWQILKLWPFLSFRRDFWVCKNFKGMEALCCSEISTCWPILTRFWLLSLSYFCINGHFGAILAEKGCILLFSWLSLPEYGLICIPMVSNWWISMICCDINGW